MDDQSRAALGTLKTSGYRLVSLWSYRAFKVTRVIPEAALYLLLLKSRAEGASTFREHLVQRQLDDTPLS